MQAAFIFLGQNNSGNMHQSNRILSVEWSWKYAYRFHDPYPCTSDDLAFEHDVSTKSHVEWRIPTRDIVSAHLLPFGLLMPLFTDYHVNRTFSSVFIASIIRVTTFAQLNREDITYTNVFPGIWTVTEQSLGITCACLPTLRPLFGRISVGSTNGSGRTFSNGGSRKIRLSKLGGKTTIKRFSEDESIRGFASLPEENMPSSSITSYATTGSKNGDEGGPKAITRTQTIEQCFENMERV